MTEALVRDLETRRCQLLLESDIANLADLVTDDLIHIHATGKRDDKQSWLRSIRDDYRFLDVERGQLDVSPFGNGFIAVGDIRQHVELRKTGDRRMLFALTAQIWRHDGTTLRQCFFQSTPTERVP